MKLAEVGKMMPAPMSWSEAFLAMFAMLIVLVFVLIYYCCIPGKVTISTFITFFFSFITRLYK